MKRRSFLLRSAAVVAGVAGALVVGWGVMPARSRLGAADLLADNANGMALNGWVRINADGSAVLVMPRAEMGQGVYTALSMLLAEELELPLDRVGIEGAERHAIYGNVAMMVDGLPFHPRELENPGALIKTTEWMVGKLMRELGIIVTGGSSSVADAWDIVRLAGATARTTLVAAAAAKFGVDAGQCKVLDGVVSCGDKKAHYGELVEAASQIEPGDVALKPASEWRIIGTPANRNDVPPKTNGTAAFGIDTRLDNMQFASVHLAPVIGGTLKSVNRAQLMKMPGVQEVISLPAPKGASGGFAVVAKNFWLAKQAGLSAKAEWNFRGNETLSSDGEIERLKQALVNDGDASVYHERGDIDQSFANAASLVEAQYQAPYLAHATMEPMNATAHFHDGMLDVWAPTQAPGFAAGIAADVCGIETEQVKVTVTYLGGGFGRRLETDFISYAAQVAKAMSPTPVQVLWAREQDMANDFYRPAQVATLRAAIDKNGAVDGLSIRAASDSVVAQWMDRATPMGGGGPDKTTVEGLFDQAYNMPNQRIDHVKVNSAIPIGFWRSVGHSHDGFIIESFIDELAHAAKKDPVAFRMTLLADSPKHAAVLKLATEKAGWGQDLPAGHAHGVALHQSFGSIVAEVAEVSIDDGVVTVHKVVCAVDCGTAVNPKIIAQQMQSSVAYGLTAALYGQIDIEKGRVAQSNFPSYQMVQLAQMPDVETHIVASQGAPSGIGEPGLPPLAPAVCNGLFKLTGKRIRQLPIKIA